MNTNYKKRWQVKVSHKSLRLNANLAKLHSLCAENTKQPHLHVNLRRLQTRMFEHQRQAQPFRTLSQTTHQRLPYRLRTASTTPVGWVTSVANLLHSLLSSALEMREVALVLCLVTGITALHVLHDHDSVVGGWLAMPDMKLETL